MLTTVRILRIGLLSCLAFAGFSALAQAARAAELKAGVARIDMTPPLELLAPLGRLRRADEQARRGRA